MNDEVIYNGDKYIKVDGVWNIISDAYEIIYESDGTHREKKMLEDVHFPANAFIKDVTILDRLLRKEKLRTIKNKKNE